MLSFGARKHLEHGLDCCVYFGRSLDGSGGIRPFRKRLCSACIMAQPRAAAADGACNVQRMQSVTVPAAAKGPLRALALGLDDEHGFCVRMVELVRFACANSEQKARDFIQANTQGLLDAAGQDEQYGQRVRDGPRLAVRDGPRLAGARKQAKREFCRGEGAVSEQSANRVC